jgi:hypothetical protein
VPPEKRYYQVAVVVLGKLYSTTLMVLLNIRPRRQPGGTICCCGSLVGVSKERGVAVTRGAGVTVGVSIHQEVQNSSGDDQGAERILTRNTSGMRGGSLKGNSRRTKRGLAGADADATMASRRQALYAPAGPDMEMSAWSMEHVPESEESMTFDTIHLMEKGETEETEAKLDETAVSLSCMKYGVESV